MSGIKESRDALHAERAGQMLGSVV
jgi:hypothetical protein